MCAPEDAALEAGPENGPGRVTHLLIRVVRLCMEFAAMLGGRRWWSGAMSGRGREWLVFGSVGLRRVCGEAREITAGRLEPFSLYTCLDYVVVDGVVRGPELKSGGNLEAKKGGRATQS